MSHAISRKYRWIVLLLSASISSRVLLCRAMALRPFASTYARSFRTCSTRWGSQRPHTYTEYLVYIHAQITCTCVHRHAHTCARVRTRTHTRTRMHTWAHARMHTQVELAQRPCIHARTHTCTHAHMRARTCTHTRTCTRTRMHIQVELAETSSFGVTRHCGHSPILHISRGARFRLCVLGVPVEPCAPLESLLLNHSS